MRHQLSLGRGSELDETIDLLGLLGNALLLSTSVAVDVGQVGSLLDAALDTVPALSDSGRHVLTVGDGITTSGELVNSLLDESALVETSSEEDGVDGNQDPGALLEEESGEAKAEPKSNLENSDQGHGRIVVVLDKVTNGVGEARRLGLLASGNSRLGLDGGKKVGSGVSCDVEDGVDGKGQNGEGDLTRPEPDQSHG